MANCADERGRKRKISLIRRQYPENETQKRSFCSSSIPYKQACESARYKDILFISVWRPYETAILASWVWMCFELSNDHICMHLILIIYTKYGMQRSLNVFRCFRLLCQCMSLLSFRIGQKGSNG
mmetsp:Transcript_16094/g.21348  ORF Transcript_16094/g.21348 Transcript_16094/m.21348 type:complete len:125 (-) Transcript_16094:69-443(-)